MKPIALLMTTSMILSGCWSDKSEKAQTFDFGKDPLVQHILATVEQEYVEAPDLAKMREGALSGMLMALDSYSLYMNEEVYHTFTESTNGEFGGVGLEVVYNDAGLRVLSPIDDTPAAKAGLQPGDIITHVDGEVVSGIPYGSILKKIHGHPGSTVELTILRGEQEPFPVRIRREIVLVNPVKFKRQDNIAYIRISYFNDKTAKALQDITKEIQKEIASSGAPLGGVIIDLRNNPGGLLDQAVAVSSVFLGKKDIVHVKSRNPAKDRLYQGTGQDLFKGIPLVVLINGGSASASEVVAAAIRDHKRGLLIGKRTFGKGSVQTLFSLKGHGGIKLTTAQFLSPLFIPIQDKGIVPDIMVDSQPNIMNLSVSDHKNLQMENDPQLQRAVDILRGIHLLGKQVS